MSHTNTFDPYFASIKYGQIMSKITHFGAPNCAPIYPLLFY